MGQTERERDGQRGKNVFRGNIFPVQLTIQARTFSIQEISRMLQLQLQQQQNSISQSGHHCVSILKELTGILCSRITAMCLWPDCSLTHSLTQYSVTHESCAVSSFMPFRSFATMLLFLSINSYIILQRIMKLVILRSRSYSYFHEPTMRIHVHKGPSAFLLLKFSRLLPIFTLLVYYKHLFQPIQ